MQCSSAPRIACRRVEALTSMSAVVVVALTYAAGSILAWSFLLDNTVLLSVQSECLPDGGDSRDVGEGEAEDHFFCAGLDVTCDQAGDLMGLADGESGDLFGG